VTSAAGIIAARADAELSLSLHGSWEMKRRLPLPPVTRASRKSTGGRRWAAPLRVRRAARV